MTAISAYASAASAAAGGGGGVAPTVSASAPGDSNTSAFSARYVGVKFDTDGEEYLLSGSSSSNFDSTLGTWLDTGTSDQVWVEYIKTAGSSFLGKTSGVRYNISVDQLFYGRDLNVGSDSFSCTCYFRFWDAASGGSTLQTTSSQVWYARYFNTCPTCCFTPDTAITMGNGSTMHIADIKVGDIIMVDGGVEAVTEVITRTDRAMFDITFLDGRVLTASDDHPLYVDGKGFAAINPDPRIDYKDLGIAEVLAVGDMVLDQDHNLNKVLMIQQVEFPETVYTFGNSCFFANGMLVY